MFEIFLIIPFTNAKVEKLFSKMKHVKTIARNWLGRDRLDLLLCVGEKGPPLEALNPHVVADMWFSDKVCCLRAGPQQPKCTQEEGDTSSYIDLDSIAMPDLKDEEDFNSFV